ncbi:MAG: YdcF family protein, partial [Anaerolineae bacterium]|nr:YdcF family protein [Anaerolineae bacterium]NIN97172.1 YdcF family protein [Anaerolineae bacterium]
VEALIFTGSIGRRDELSEAAVARNYAIQLGVPPNDIYIEELSTETFENLLEAKSIIDREGFVQILLVSDPLHMRRALTMASDIGI